VEAANLTTAMNTDKTTTTKSYDTIKLGIDAHAKWCCVIARISFFRPGWMADREAGLVGVQGAILVRWKAGATPGSPQLPRAFQSIDGIPRNADGIGILLGRQHDLDLRNGIDKATAEQSLDGADDRKWKQLFPFGQGLDGLAMAQP